VKNGDVPASAPAAVRWAAAWLRGLVESPEVDAELLLRHVTKMTRAQIYSQARDLTPAESEALDAAVWRRAGGEPLQYITGTQTFRGIELAVGPGVFIPRPETELVCERALELIERIENPRVADIGTGSGAIALALATERPDAKVWATDISPEALTWARRNLERTGAGNVTLLEGDLLNPLSGAGSFDLIVSNPPYLTDEMVEAAAPDVRDHEPRTALVSTLAGLGMSGRIIPRAGLWLRPRGWLILETWPGLAEDLKQFFEAGPYLEVALRRDLAGSVRMVEGRRMEYEELQQALEAARLDSQP
jgi:release factor glutamine methyltransferase